MALYADRVKQSLGVTGTGTITLTLATTGNGYQSFLTAFGTGTQTVAYCIADQSGPNWEVGTGSYNGSANTLARTTVLASSNGGLLTNFSGGTQDVFCTAPAKYLDIFTSGNQGVVPASGGGTTNFLRADGTFAAPAATAPAGSTTQIQFNNAGAFGASANFTYATGTNTFTVGPAGATTIIETLAPTGSTVAGTLTVRGKNASATNGNGGPINLTGGNGLGSGFGGNVNVNAGNSIAVGGLAGTLSLGAGNGYTQGGAVFFTAGFANSGTDNGAVVYANGGERNVSGGSMQMFGGQSINGTGGGIDVAAGGSDNSSSGFINFSLTGGATDDGEITFKNPNGEIYAHFKNDVPGGVQQIGFFNVTPASQQSATTLAEVITALQAYGLLA